eukprot:2013270-Amphidinium_carterae.1
MVVLSTLLRSAASVQEGGSIAKQEAPFCKMDGCHCLRRWPQLKARHLKTARHSELADSQTSTLPCGKLENRQGQSLGEFATPEFQTDKKGKASLVDGTPRREAYERACTLSEGLGSSGSETDGSSWNVTTGVS